MRNPDARIAEASPSITPRTSPERSGPKDLDDAILLLRDPRLGKRGMILAAKLAARELGPIIYEDCGEVWNTGKMTTDEEWMAFAKFLRARSPSWSPDGSKIAFVGTEIYVMNADGTGITTVTDNAGTGPLGPSDPAWSPA